MMAKLMNDSLVSFAQHFGYDGFRFDLMGHIPKQAIIDAREAVRTVDADTYFMVKVGILVRWRTTVVLSKPHN